ncbi:MAG: helix-turn-helix domain-containing protein [Mobilicoccus sp.]|nr:helix-turn-helix domain-containing protein [Mobilicoccus sp.]
MSLSDRIKDCRHQAGLTQAQVAESLRVSRQAVTKWESGVGTPDIENLAGLARLFGVSVDHLLADGGASDNVVLRRDVDVASLEPYRPAGMVQGSRAHAAMKQVFPSATVWPLVRTRRNTRTEEVTEWLGALFANTPFNVFGTTDALSNRDAYYLVEDGTRHLLARVGTDAVEARELPERVSGPRFTVGQDQFRRYRRTL